MNNSMAIHLIIIRNFIKSLEDKISKKLSQGETDNLNKPTFIKIHY